MSWRLFATILNVLALPVYALMFTTVAEHVGIGWSWQPIVGFVGGASASAAAVFAWHRSERAGAIVQLAFMTPIIILALIPSGGMWHAFDSSALSDHRILLGVVLAVLVPAAVTATSIFSLKRHRR